MQTWEFKAGEEVIWAPVQATQYLLARITYADKAREFVDAWLSNGSKMQQPHRPLLFDPCADLAQSELGI